MKPMDEIFDVSFFPFAWNYGVSIPKFVSRYLALETSFTPIVLQNSLILRCNQQTNNGL